MPMRQSCPSCGGLLEYNREEALLPTAVVGTCRSCETRVGVVLAGGRCAGQFPLPERWDLESIARIHLLVCSLYRAWQFADPTLRRAAEEVDVRFFQWRLRRPWRWVPTRWQAALFQRLGRNRAPLIYVGRLA